MRSLRTGRMCSVSNGSPFIRWPMASVVLNMLHFIRALLSQYYFAHVCISLTHPPPPPLQTGDDAILNAVHAVWPGIDHGVYGRSEWRYFLPTVNDNGFHCD